MKPISEMSLQECLEVLQDDESFFKNPPYVYHAYDKAIARRISDLTRWIPVGERLPTKKDADEDGNVLVCSFDLDSRKLYYESWVFTDVTVQGGTQYKPRYWKRIDKPEGV